MAFNTGRVSVDTTATLLADSLPRGTEEGKSITLLNTGPGDLFFGKDDTVGTGNALLPYRGSIAIAVDPDDQVWGISSTTTTVEVVEVW